MIQEQSERSAPYAWLYDPACFDQMNSDYFSAPYWDANNRIYHQETGRGTTLFVTHKQNGKNYQLVLRHYLRGGMMSKLSHDKYLFSSFDHCRSFSEFRILSHLQNLGLPAPKPAAAQVRKCGLLYQADILIHQIPQSKDLLNILESPQTSSFYKQLGALIARFHQHGIYHADLNIKNILFDVTENFSLIDFDRAQVKTPDNKWQQSNLERLKRSFEKEVNRHGICWSLQDWKKLTDSYAQTMAQSH